jgi:NRAMP (natural resistance-associated macrophage protein)-like metal ion transporter
MATLKPVRKQAKSASPKKPGLIRSFISSLGPGVITGAADDDPSGVATYSITGAQSGTALLWTAFITWPLMGAVQMTCARIGMVTGQGLAGAFRHKFPRPIIIIISLALLAANTINIGSDLAGMADAGTMLTGFNAHFFVVLFAVTIVVLTIKFRYLQISGVLKWLCLALFAYVITAFLVVSDWSAIVHDTFIPSWPADHNAWANLVAILGTTISPYLFFWQASQEVEEEKAMGRRMTVRRWGATSKEITIRKLDVGVGTFSSNLVMFFIILTTAMTLHRHGDTNIETSRQAAEALRPLAGQLAYILYTLGILGVGFLAIPTLSGSAAYALAETFRWRQGLDEKFHRAKLFYGVIILSTAIGILLNYLKINPVKALFWTAILNGLLAPFLLVGILILSSDKKLMHEQPSSKLSWSVVLITTLVMFAAAIGMFVF